MISKRPQGKSGILTFEMLSLNIALRNDILGDLVQGSLKVLNLLGEVVHSLQGRFFVHVLGRLSHQEVYFLGFFVQLSPAKLYRGLALRLKQEGLGTFAGDSLDGLPVLSGRECDLFFVDASDRVGDSHAQVKGSGRDAQTDGFHRVQQELKSLGV